MEDLLRGISENHFVVLAVILTLFMFVFSGLLKLIEYIVDKLTKKESEDKE